MFEQLDIDKADKRDIQFKSKIEAYWRSDQDKLSEELYNLQQDAKKCEDELRFLKQTLVFSNTLRRTILLKDVKKKIEKQEKLDTIKSRMTLSKVYNF